MSGIHNGIVSITIGSYGPFYFNTEKTDFCYRNRFSCSHGKPSFPVSVTFYGNVLYSTG